MNPNNPNDKKLDEDPANRDPITDEPGAHPVGTAIGAAVGGAAGIGAAAAAGAAMGSAVGPVGTAAGAVVGAVAGGLLGSSAGESLNPTVVDPQTEERYWRESHAKQPYASTGDYNSYAPFYELGYTAANRYQGRNYDEIEPELRAHYEAARGENSLDWTQGRPATRAAWEKVTKR
ncbi:hypothetical protein [Chitinimonas lacunae]|uniref:Glycine zipper domain-containing protein n=1 Tax=Chitinimonas lacunae TaxID=1963018 RepID=A0ABV8ML33_9NEIS